MQTKPSDSAEQAAERAAAAAIRDEYRPPAPAAAQALDLGAPPWGCGRPLSRDERQWHEPRVGADLADVRVHEGSAPSQWARLLGARAFSIGRDIVLGSGEYAPSSQAGRYLMAHELSHVVQARGRTPVLARVALSAADFDALADSLHDAILKPTADKELIYVALQKLERDPAAIASLGAAYKKNYKKDLTTDLPSKLTGRRLDLANALIAKKSSITLAKPPSKSKDYESLARAVNAALLAKTVDAEGVYAALLPLGRDPTMVATLRTTYKKLLSGSDLDTDIASTLAGAQQSYALYLLNGPLPATPKTPVGFAAQPSGGSAPATAPPPAPGGTVTAETKVPYQTASGGTGTFGFGVGYSGALSAETRLIQFIEREIDYDPAGGGTRTALDKEIGATSGAGTYKYRLTTVTGSPRWTVDSSDAANPFFDETHSSTTWREPTSVAIYDAPNSREKHEVADLFTAGHKNVASRAHFEIYFIRDFSAIYSVEVEIIWTFSGPGRPKNINRAVKAAGPVSALPAAFKSALVARYPAFSYIR